MVVLVLQGKPILESPHATTGLIGLSLLAAQTVLATVGKVSFLISLLSFLLRSSFEYLLILFFKGHFLWLPLPGFFF